MLQISAVIPTYNRSILVVRAIKSVLAQTYPVSEVIVVDDGSTDGTQAAIQSYLASNHPSSGLVRYVRQEKNGVAMARNRGVAAATGDWIAFLDSDDVWLPDKLKWQVRAIEEFAGVSAVCATDATYVNNPLMTKTAFQQDGVRCEGVIGIFSNFQKRMACAYAGVYMPTLLVQREAIHAAGGFDPSLVVSEDTDFLFQLAGITSVSYVNRPLVEIDRTPARTNGLMELYEKGSIACETAQYRYEKWLKTCPDSDVELRKLLRWGLHHTHIGWANWHLVNGDYERARHSLSLAMDYGFSRRAVFKSFAITVAPGLTRSVVIWRRRGRGTVASPLVA